MVAEATLAPRFWAKVDIRGPEDCWTWRGAHDYEHGYGHIGMGATTKKGAHRLAYELAKGPIPLGLQIDHLCRNRRCVNPDHLEAVTARENIRRGERAQRTHCARGGHPLDEANTYRDKRGWRRCKTCSREAAREAKRRVAA